MPHTTLIATDALAAELEAGRCVVVDCRYELANEAWGREAYLASHIPGAIYASLSHDLAATSNGSNGRHPLPSPEVLAERFGRMGITTGTQVVAYDQDSGMWASRLWWMLRYMGHDQVAVLDGGLAKWTREGRPVRAGEEKRKPAIFISSVRGAMYRHVVDVEARLHDRAVLLLDARAPERFEGKTEPIDRVPGHIPGAANAFYKHNITEAGTMKTPAELREQFATILGPKSADQVVMYCGSGVSACHNLLAMEHAGLSGAALYVGSWSEWSSDPGRPVEAGPGPWPKAQGPRPKAQG